MESSNKTFRFKNFRQIYFPSNSFKHPVFKPIICRSIVATFNQKYSWYVWATETQRKISFQWIKVDERSVTRYTWHECRLRSGWTQRNILTLRRDLPRRAGFPTPPSFSFRLFAATYTSLGNARSSRIGFVIPRELLDSVWSSIRSLYHHISSPYSSLAGFDFAEHALHFFFSLWGECVAKLICFPIYYNLQSVRI